MPVFLFIVWCTWVFTEVNAGFVSLDYTAGEGDGLLQVCVEVTGTEALSQSSLVRVQTISGTAEGI